MSGKLQVKIIHLADKSYFIVLRDGKNITETYSKAFISFDKNGKISSIKLAQ